MSQEFAVPLNTEDAMSRVASNISAALDTLRSNFAGITAPSDPAPVEGQAWWDSSNNTDWRYNGAAWTPAGGRLASTVEATDFTVDASKGIMFLDCTGGVVEATLPSAVGINGTEYRFVKQDVSANAGQITPDGAEEISGSASYSLGTQYDSVTIVSDGANWFITAEYP